MWIRSENILRKQRNIYLSHMPQNTWPKPDQKREVETSTRIYLGECWLTSGIRIYGLYCYGLSQVKLAGIIAELYMIPCCHWRYIKIISVIRDYFWLIL